LSPASAAPAKTYNRSSMALEPSSYRREENVEFTGRKLADIVVVAPSARAAAAARPGTVDAMKGTRGGDREGGRTPCE